MPLSDKQRRAMERHIRANTEYSSNDGNAIYFWHGTYIIDSVETIMAADGPKTRDLCLLNSFIHGRNKADFWHKMAGIATDWKFDWHQVEFGPALNAEDHRERFVYTWTTEGQVFKFFTKATRIGRSRELRWYMCNQAEPVCDDLASEDDTDSEDIVL